MTALDTLLGVGTPSLSDPLYRALLELVDDEEADARAFAAENGIRFRMVTFALPLHLVGTVDEALPFRIVERGGEWTLRLGGIARSGTCVGPWSMFEALRLVRAAAHAHDGMAVTDARSGSGAGLRVECPDASQRAG